MTDTTDPQTEPDLTEAQKAYNVAQYEMFQLAAYGHCTYTPRAELLTAEGKADQADYNGRIRKAREQLEAAVLRLVAEHAETFRGDWGVPAAWLRSLAEDPAELSLLAVRPDERDFDTAPAVLPPAADRAAVLREAADAVMRLDYMELRADFEYDSQRDAWDGGTIDAAHELRRLADVAQYGDDCEMAASWRRDGFGEDEIAAMLRRGGGEEQQAETQAPCTCAAAGDCFAPSGHYADCPQATPPAVVAEPGKEA